jgi:hypothetical protein
MSETTPASCVSGNPGRYTLIITPTARRQLAQHLPEAVAFAAHELIVGALLENPSESASVSRPRSMTGTVRGEAPTASSTGSTRRSERWRSSASHTIGMRTAPTADLRPPMRGRETPGRPPAGMKKSRTSACKLLALCNMKTLYLRNVPDDVVRRLQRLADRDGTSVGAVAVRELSDVSRRADNPALVGELPDLDVDVPVIVEGVEHERATR